MSLAPSSASNASEPVLVHVLFMDIVGSTKYFTDDQRSMLENLQSKVRATSEYRKSMAKNELISLPTGDGMALVFLNDVEAPLRCAIELARSLRDDSTFALRMGIHSGPVFIVEDINGQKNASGAGINRAQRVMDCGDHGHILLSDAAADVLRQLRYWSAGLHDIGECQAKGGWYHVWSYYDAEAGNANPPLKSKRLIRRRRVLALSSAAVFAVLLLAVGAFEKFQPKPVAPERSLTYSLMVKSPQGVERIYAREMVLPAHYGIKFRFQPAQSGFLYLLNQGPESSTGRSWHWMFPYPAYRGGSAAVGSGEVVTLPAEVARYYELDGKSGKEAIFLVWSEREVAQLETIKAAVFQGNGEGALTLDQARSVEAYLSGQTVNVESLSGESGTTLRVHGPVLIRLIPLEHL